MLKINIKELYGQEKLDRILNLSERKIREMMINRKEYMVKKNILDWETSGKYGVRPTFLQPNECAKLINEFFQFAKISNQEKTPLHVYHRDIGLYTSNYDYIDKLLNDIAPNKSANFKNMILSHLKGDIDDIQGITKIIKDPDLIVVGNGIYDKKSKELKPFTPEYVFISKVETNYIENPSHPELDGWIFEEWLDEISNNDSEIYTLLMQVINESLNGNYTRGKAFFLIGTGNNGKGTYQRLLEQIVGEDNTEMLKANEFEQRFALSGIQNASLIIGDDVPPNVFTKDFSVFKSIITGDPVSIEGKGEQPFTKTLTPTIVQSTNGMPKTSDKSNGLLRRIVIVPFLAEFESGKTENTKIKNVYLKDKRLLEYIMYQAINLEFDTFTIPEISKRKLEEYKLMNDPIYEFKVDVIDTWEDLERLPINLIYKIYEIFCEENKLHPLGKNNFSRELLNRLSDGWEKKNTKVSISKIIDSCPHKIYSQRIGIVSSNDLEVITHVCFVKK